MRIRHATALASVPVFALGLASCVAAPADEPERGPAALSTEVLFAAFSHEDDGACPAGDAHAYDSSFVDVNDDEVTQCTFVDPDLQLTIARGEIDYLEPGDQGLSHDAVVLAVDAADQEELEALTARLAEQSDPHNRMAIIVDDEVLTTPSIVSALTGGEVQIVGGYDVARIYDALTS